MKNASTCGSAILLVCSTLALGWHSFAGSSANFVPFRAVGAQSAPTLSSISPAQTPKGQAPAKLTLKGTGFVAGSKVFFDSTEVTAKIKPSGTKIILKNPSASLFQNDRTYQVRVTTPGGQSSNSVPFVVGTGQDPNAPASIAVLEPKTFTLNVGMSVALKVAVLDKAGNPIPNAPVTFQGDEPTVASVTGEGVVTGAASGAATIQIGSGTITRNVVFSVNAISRESSGIVGSADLEAQPSTGSLFASDFVKHTVKVRKLGQPMTDFTGKSGTPGNRDGSADGVLFDGPLGLGIGQGVYIADVNNQTVRRMDPSTGEVRTVLRLIDIQAVAGVERWGPRDVAVDSLENLYIADAVNHVVWWAIQTGPNTRRVKILAGALGQPGTSDGPGGAARFNSPQKLALVGNILNVVESSTSIRQIAVPSGTVKTAAASVTAGVGHASEFDGSASRSNRQNDFPPAVSADRFGNVFLADPQGSVSFISFDATGNSRRDELAPPGTVLRPVGVTVVGSSIFCLDAATADLIRIDPDPPLITRVNPPSGTTGITPTKITVTGMNFHPETQVFVNRTQMDAVVLGSRQLEFFLPPRPVGGTDVITLNNRGGNDSFTFTVEGDTPPPVVNLFAYPGQVTILEGETILIRVEAEDNVSVGRVEFSVNGNLPSDITPQLAPNPSPDGKTVLTLTAGPSVPPGDYEVEVTGTAPGKNIRPVRVPIIVEPFFQMSFQVTPSNREIPRPTESITLNYGVILLRDGNTQPVTPVVSGLPPGAQAVFSPSTLGGTQTSTTLNVTLQRATPAAEYFMTIRPQDVLVGSSVTVSPKVTHIVPAVTKLVVREGSSSGVMLGVAPPTQTVASGRSAAYAVAINRTNFTGVVTLGLESSGGAGTGISFRFSPNSTSGNEATLTINTNSGAVTPPGTYRFIVTGTSPGITVANSSEFSLVVTQGPPPTITATVAPASQTVMAGQTAAYGVSAVIDNYFETVLLSLAGNLPPNAGIVLRPTECASPCASSLSIRTAADTPPGTYNMQLIAMVPGLNPASFDFSLTVQPPPPPSITLSMNPTTRIVKAGQGTTYQVGVAASNFNGTLTIGVSGTIPAGSSFSFNPTTFPIPGNTTLVVTTSASTPPGTYNLQLVGTSTPSVTIAPVPFTLQVTP